MAFRIDFLTPLIGTEIGDGKTVPFPWLGVSAQPLRYLDYLIENPIRAVLLLDRGAILANLPNPARYALHQIIVAERRGGTWFPKRAKDRAQSEALIDFLAKNDVGLLDEAFDDLAMRHPSWMKILRKGIANLSSSVGDLPWVRERFGSTAKNHGPLS